MIEGLCIYVLNIVCIVVLFKHILGFELSRELAVILIITGLAIKILISGNFGSVIMLHALSYLILLMPVLIFKGRKISIFLISLNMNLWLSCSNSMLSAIFGDFGMSVYLLSQLVLLGILLALMLITMEYREVIYKDVYKIRNGFLILLFIILFVLTYKAGYTGIPDMEMMGNVIGTVNILTGLLGILSIAVTCLLQVLYVQKYELKKAIALNEQCIKNQCTQYDILLAKDKEMREFRHEFKSHITALKTYSDNKKYDDLSKYLKEIDGLSCSSDKIVHTGNQIVDGVLNRYIALGKNDDVKVRTLGKLPDKMKIELTDLNAVISNAISNGYEAALKCGNDKFLNVEFLNDDENIYIRISNSSLKVEHFETGNMKTDKKEKDLHGFGVGIIKETVKKYNGEVSWKYDTGIMTTYICMTIK